MSHINIPSKPWTSEEFYKYMTGKEEDKSAKSHPKAVQYITIQLVNYLIKETTKIRIADLCDEIKRIVGNGKPIDKNWYYRYIYKGEFKMIIDIIKSIHVSKRTATNIVQRFNNHLKQSKIVQEIENLDKFIDVKLEDIPIFSFENEDTQFNFGDTENFENIKSILNTHELDDL